MGKHEEEAGISQKEGGLYLLSSLLLGRASLVFVEEEYDLGLAPFA